MEERGSVALSSEVLHTIKFSSGAEIPLLKGEAHVCLVASLFFMAKLIIVDPCDQGSLGSMYSKNMNPND